MEMESDFLDIKDENGKIKEKDKMMVMLINMLSVSIKKFYKMIKMLLKDIHFENEDNKDINKETVNVMKQTLKNFLKEVKDIFLKLKKNHNRGRNHSSKYCNLSHIDINNNSTPTKSIKLGIKNRNTSPITKRTISLLNINTSKQMHKSYSVKVTNENLGYNEIIYLTKEIILNIKELFLNKKDIFSNVKNYQMNKFLSLLNQYVKVLTLSNDNNHSPMKLINKSFFDNNQIIVPSNKNRKNVSMSNSISSSFNNNYINISEISSSPRITDYKYINSNTIYSNHSKHNIKGKNSSFIKELKDKALESQYINNSICYNKQEQTNKTLSKWIHIQKKELLKDKCNNNSCSLKHISIQTDEQYNENEEKLKQKITELSDFIVKQKEMIDNDIIKHKTFHIENIIMFSYNGIIPSQNDYITLTNKYSEIKNNFVNKNEIITFNFSITNNTNITELSKINEQLILFKNENESLQNQLYETSHELKTKTKSYNDLLVKLSVKEKSLIDSNEEISSLSNQIKALQFKLFHLEPNLKNNNSSNTIKAFSNEQNIFYQNVPKEKLIQYLNVLIKENDKFTKENAKLRNELSIKKQECINLNMQFKNLLNYYGPEIKEKERIISDLKETLKHKSQMLITQATQIEKMGNMNKLNENKIGDLNKEIKKKEKVINELNTKNCKLVLEKDDLKNMTKALKGKNGK